MKYDCFLFLNFYLLSSEQMRLFLLKIQRASSEPDNSEIQVPTYFLRNRNNKVPFKRTFSISHFLFSYKNTQRKTYYCFWLVEINNVHIYNLMITLVNQQIGRLVDHFKLLGHCYSTSHQPRDLCKSYHMTNASVVFTIFTLASKNYHSALPQVLSRHFDNVKSSRMRSQAII